MVDKVKIGVDTHISSDDFSDFITFRLYCYFLPNSIPKGLSKKFKKEENEDMKSITTFFIEYTDSITDLNLLHILHDELNDKIGKGVGIGSNGNIARAIKSLLELLDTRIKNLEGKKGINNEAAVVKDNTKKILEIKPPKVEIIEINKNIKLENGVWDFETWDNIYKSYILCFGKIANFPSFRATKNIKDFIDNLKPENRGGYNVFIFTNDFLEHFGFVEFYKYLLRLLETSSKKDILAKAILEFFPIFEIKSGNNKLFLELQAKIIGKSKKLNGNAK